MTGRLGKEETNVGETTAGSLKFSDVFCDRAAFGADIDATVRPVKVYGAIHRAHDKCIFSSASYKT